MAECVEWQSLLEQSFDVFVIALTGEAFPTVDDEKGFFDWAGFTTGLVVAFLVTVALPRGQAGAAEIALDPMTAVARFDRVQAGMIVIAPAPPAGEDAVGF